MEALLLGTQLLSQLPVVVVGSQVLLLRKVEGLGQMKNN